MTLIKSISGIRGTIGGIPGDSLSPVDIVKFSAAYGTWIRKRTAGVINIVVGRDARSSGPMVNSLVIMTLRSMGINVRDLGLATTPTVELAVTGSGSNGGIIITASHNPANWNALKLLNEKGEFLSAADGNEVLDFAEKEDFEFVSDDEEGALIIDNSWGQKHIDQILHLDLVEVGSIKKANLSVAVDCINSVGGIIVPELLHSLGVGKVILLNETPNGDFAHNPEPLAENLKEISALVPEKMADLGFVVDPDVDRLAIICEDGTMFGEEYTLVAVADYVLSKTKGDTVSNLSSTRALKDITESHGCHYFSSAVGEVNVVEEMKKRKAIIGGEGNGGVIYPELHYGRDALVGIALFLTFYARSGMKCSSLRNKFPGYVIVKKRVEINNETDFKSIINDIRTEFHGYKIDERDGLRIDLADSWAQVRKSNTEAIIRVYAEGRTIMEADELAERIIKIVKKH
jgi:phosphomannomutase